MSFRPRAQRSIMTSGLCALLACACVGCGHIALLPRISITAGRSRTLRQGTERAAARMDTYAFITATMSPTRAERPIVVSRPPVTPMPPDVACLVSEICRAVDAMARRASRQELFERSER